jgi:hypothetical protein
VTGFGAFIVAGLIAGWIMEIAAWAVRAIFSAGGE